MIEFIIYTSWEQRQPPTTVGNLGNDRFPAGADVGEETAGISRRKGRTNEGEKEGGMMGKGREREFATCSDVLSSPVLPSVATVEMARAVDRGIGGVISIERILLPVQRDEFDGEKHGEESEKQKPGQTKP